MASFPGQKAGSAPAAPTTPSSLTATPQPSGTQIFLQWNQSLDGDLQISYIVSRCSGVACTNFTVITTTVANAQNFVDSGLQLATSYSYSIQAVDGAGNLSGVSNIATAITPAVPLSLTQTQSQVNYANKWPLDMWSAQSRAKVGGLLAKVLTPTVPGNFVAATISSTEIDLSWTASTETNVPVSFYTVTINPGSVIVQISVPATTYQDISLTPSTTYTYTISATDIHGNTSNVASTSATTQAAVASLNFPRVAITANGGDQSYGKNTTTGFTTYSAAAPGTAAYTVMQQLGSFDLVFPLAGSFEGWSSSGISKQDLVNAIKGKGSFPNVKNTARTPKVFLYSIMESSQNASSGLPYQTFANLIINNNWWTYESAGGTGTILPSGNSGFFEVNYSVAWATSAGSAASDQSITGHVYGVLSNGQGCADSAATYFSSSLLTTNRLDARFTGLPSGGAAPNADGLFLDNCFLFPNNGGNLPANGSWDGIGVQGSGTIAAYPSGASSLLARGQHHFFATMQAYLASCNPGSTYYSIGNFGGYANTSGNGNTHTISASGMDNTLHGGLLEFVIGNNGPSWQSFQTFSQVLTNYNFAMDYCLAPKLVGFGIQVPATDGSQTATFQTGGVATSVTTGTALEYQEARLGLGMALLDDGYAAYVVHGLDYSVVRWYDEFGDDSLTQVNVKRGYLGSRVGSRPTSSAISLGTLGVWIAKFTNGIAVINPWGNGAQTVTAAQLTTATGVSTYRALGGTQQPAINNGATYSSRAFADGDAQILLAGAPLSITTTSPLSAGTNGSAYSTTLAATGGTPPYTWSLVSATPNTGAWIHVSSAGVLSGTPSTVETESIVVKVTDSLGSSATKTLSLTVNAAASGFLPAGHFVAAKMPMAVVHPRPDTETGAFTGTVLSRARLAFFNGTNPVQCEIPLAVQGGARPLVWSVIAGPAGMTVGAAHPSIPGGTSKYGVVTWTPTAAISKASPVTVTIQATDQQLNTLQFSWTMATSSATTDFLFVNSSTGNDSTGNGTFAAPYASLAKVMGTNLTQTTFPGSRVYLSGSFQWPAQTGSVGEGGGAGYYTIDSSKVPVVYMALPGSTVTIDASVSQIIDNGPGCNDLYFAGSSTSRLAIVGSAATALETHTFELYNAQRCTWWNVDFQNPINRVSANGNTNSTSIFTSNSGSPSIRNYYLITGCSETGRSGSAGNSMLMTSLFSIQNVVFEFNNISGTAGFGVFFKDSNRFITAAYNSVNLLGANGASPMMFGCQTNNLGSPPAFPGFCEACYNFLVGGPLFFDFQGFAGALQHWSYRNTIYNNQFNYNYALGNFGPAGTGPYFTDSDVAIAKTPGGAIAGASVSFTIANNEAWLAWSGSPPPANCPINTTTGALVNSTTAWRTLYLGIRGWEVA